MIRRFLFALLMALPFLFVACDGRRPPLTDFDKGFNDGINAVRAARKEWGVLGDAAVFVARMGPGHSDKSKEWNAGFRAGMAAEVKR